MAAQFAKPNSFFEQVLHKAYSAVGARPSQLAFWIVLFGYFLLSEREFWCFPLIRKEKKKKKVKLWWSQNIHLQLLQRKIGLLTVSTFGHIQVKLA